MYTAPLINAGGRKAGLRVRRPERQSVLVAVVGERRRADARQALERCGSSAAGIADVHAYGAGVTAIAGTAAAASVRAPPTARNMPYVLSVCCETCAPTLPNVGWQALASGRAKALAYCPRLARKHLPASRSCRSAQHGGSGSLGSQGVGAAPVHHGHRVQSRSRERRCSALRRAGACSHPPRRPGASCRGSCGFCAVVGSGCDPRSGESSPVRDVNDHRRRSQQQ